MGQYIYLVVSEKVLILQILLLEENMQKIILFLFLLLFPVGAVQVAESRSSLTETSDCEKLYEELGLSGRINFDAFEQAFEGYGEIPGKKREVLTLIDFSKPSTAERLYVIDLARRKMLFVSHVSHGRNSGDNYATSFSNRSGSHQSSLGFYLTENTYIGRNGYSLVLNGLEPGVNDNAKARAVVMHGAAYANPSVIAAQGRLGRSFGCPALPEALNREVIDAIKGGSVLYIYAGNKEYLAQSTVLSSRGLVSL